MIFSKVISAVFFVTVLVGCSATLPVKGYTNDRQIWTGSLKGKKEFEMSNGSVTCTGSSETNWSAYTIIIPFSCIDGRTGKLSETKALSAKATAEFSDGTQGEFYWGVGLQ